MRENIDDHSISFLKKIFLQKWKCCMSRSPFRRVIFQLKSLKANENFFAEAICFYFNKSSKNGKFPNRLKLANITPVFKQGVRTSKDNYRPVSILPAFSKMFERLLSRQLLDFFDYILSKFQCGFRKGYGTQHCLLLMLEIWKELLTVTKLLVHY